MCMYDGTQARLLDLLTGSYTGSSRTFKMMGGEHMGDICASGKLREDLYRKDALWPLRFEMCIHLRDVVIYL